MELAIVLMSFVIIIMALVIMWLSIDIDEIKKLLKKADVNTPQAKESSTYSNNYERCTCGTEYDFDGIPRSKSCKKHNI